MDAAKRTSTVMFVDDEEAICELTRTLLEQEGYHVLIARSGREALDLLDENSVALVISDFKMDEMNGIELLQNVNASYPEIPRILVTGYANVEVIVKAINEGQVSRIIEKPWDTEEFLKAVESATALYQRRLNQKNLEQKFQSHTRELEQRVAERTRELTMVIDELQKRNENLAATHQQLIQSDKMASLGLMAGTLAHDISNPLFVILGNIEILSTRDYLNPKDRELIQKVKEQVRRIESLIQSIRNFSKKSAGAYEKLNLLEALEESFLLTRKMTSLKKIEVLTQYPENIPFVYGNQNQIEQVLMNIIQNGVQSMDENGTLTCEIESVTQENDTETEHVWQVAISDTGSGIPRDKVDEIFDAFYTTREEGTGLGLNICQRIVSEHRGTIDVYSTEGKGTTFVIKFPAYSEENVKAMNHNGKAEPATESSF